MSSDAPLELRLIGELAVLRDGVPQKLPASRKTRALLAYLAGTCSAHRRDRLCSLLWEMPDDPKASLRWSLSKLRGLLDDGQTRLLSEGETVRLDMAGARIDLDELRGFADIDTDRLEQLAEAVSASRFCEGLELPRCEEFEAWCAAMREDVRQLLIAMHRELAGRLAGEPDRALPSLRRLTELEQFDGSVREQLVATLVEAGRPAEAEAQRRIAVASLTEAGVPVHSSLERAVVESAFIAEPSAPAAARQQVQFCTAPDGTGIAYSCTGSGPPLVKTANWLNHLEFEWESPIWRHWINELSSEHMLLRYDERGNGLSDWKVEDLSFDALVQDLETVVDAAKVERFDMIAISQGCAVGIAYAVKHPERVRRMILIGGYAAGWAKRGDPEELERREAMVALTRTGWGKDNPAFRQMFTTLYFPGATREQADWFNELQRVSASPEGAQRLQRALSVIDVRELLPQVRTPTIVFHARDDAVVPFDAGRFVAARIPGAQFVALDSSNHIILEQEPAWPVLVEQVRTFLA